jgi:hypothetical protein
MKCGAKAVLIVVREVEGTTTSLAKGRSGLACALEQGHAGPHRDATVDFPWEGPPDKVVTLLHNED